MKIVLTSQTHWKGLRNPPGSCTDYTLRTRITDQWISINDLCVQDCTEYKTWLLPQGTKDRRHVCAHTHKGKQYRAVKINCLMNSTENKCHNNSEEGRRSLWVGAAGEGFRIQGGNGFEWGFEKQGKEKRWEHYKLRAQQEHRHAQGTVRTSEVTDKEKRPSCQAP